MARIVLGLGTSHTPLFTLDSSEWRHRAEVDYANPALNLTDGRRLSYPQLLAETGPRYEDAAQPDVLMRKAAQCEAALDCLSGVLHAVEPDVVIVVGDDQGELFSPANQPAFAIQHGDTLYTSDIYGHESLPAWKRKMGRGYLMDSRHAMPGAGNFAIRLIEGLVDEGVDVASVRVAENGSLGLGHAFGFIAWRLFKGKPLPIVPVLLNTYFPPNVPSAARCYDIGTALRRVVEAAAPGLRVAIIASGGLSHFVVDEALDRGILEAFARHDAGLLRALPRHALVSGSSEILNWVLAAGALEGLPVKWTQYLPLYRTPAGTGVGAAFVVWSDDPALGQMGFPAPL